MIYGHLDIPGTYAFLLSHPLWKLSFDWLKTVTPQTPRGITKLHGDQVYANVHGYRTFPSKQTRFESHRRYVDLQYCITGGERITCGFTRDLQPQGPYNKAKDLLFYREHPTGTTLLMTPRHFAIFFPDDAHAPKQMDEQNAEVFKVVVKIDLSPALTRDPL